MRKIIYIYILEMKRKSGTVKKYIRKYTAYAPKTLKATKKLGSTTMSKVKYFFSKSMKTLKNTTKRIDRGASKSIVSLTKRR
jgi:hypothetical protein